MTINLIEIFESKRKVRRRFINPLSIISVTDGPTESSCIIKFADGSDIQVMESLDKILTKIGCATCGPL